MARTKTKSAILLFAAWVAAPACAPGEKATEERPRFDSFALQTFDGDSLSLADLRGKVSLVIFWASWCPGCQAELPLLDSLSAAVEHPDFAIVAINDEWNEGVARGFAAAKGLQMPLLLGRGAMWEQYQYFGLPYMVLLDREGRVVQEYYGFPGRRAFDHHVAERAMQVIYGGKTSARGARVESGD
jgi:thiol-disulfide isomerase/thioredoxin